MKKIILLALFLIFSFNASAFAGQYHMVKAYRYHGKVFAWLFKNLKKPKVTQFSSRKAAINAFKKSLKNKNNINIFGERRYLIDFNTGIKSYRLDLRLNNLSIFTAKLKKIGRIMTSRNTLRGFKRARRNWCEKWYSNKKCPPVMGKEFYGKNGFTFNSSNIHVMGLMQLIEKYYNGGQ